MKQVADYQRQVFRNANCNGNNLNEGKTKSVKILFYFLILCLISKHNEESNGKIHVINGKAELKFRKYKDYKDIYYGGTFSGISDLIYQRSFLSPFKRSYRIVLIIRAILAYLRERGGVGYWLEVIVIDEYIKLTHPEIVLSNGHFDRTTTILSELCDFHSVKFYMKQHGLVFSGRYVPVKIKCQKCIVYDENEKRKFKNNIIANDDCEYEIYYDNKIVFSTVHTNNNIGIIDAPFANMPEIIERTIKAANGCNVYIMQHPLRRSDYYIELNNSPRIYVGFKKIFNLDIIVSPPSTLAYDYIKNGFCNPILFVDVNHSIEEFNNLYPNMLYIDRYSQMEELVTRYSMQVPV